MQKKSYAEQIKASEVLLGGFRQHMENFLEKGYTTEKYITDFEKMLNATISFNNEQEKSKADMVTNTVELNRMLDDLNDMRQHLKQIVRSHVPSHEWKSFGMQYRSRGRKYNGTPNPPPDDNNDDNPTDNVSPQKEAVKNVSLSKDGKTGFILK